ncbi:Protein FAR1-RELATED SEQUENCE 3 [Hordeum vulgare]|nr:Protein FAR1-RELATED SEQUENCE 3 [Hordeum vulgare]
MDQSMGEMCHGAPSLDPIASGPVCSAHPGESQASMSIAVGEEIHGKDFLDDGASVGFSARCTEATSGWTRRVRIGKAPVEREMSAARNSALELSVRAYITKRDVNVANPVIGTSFDSIDEAYNFYNLYSWEVGFGIRLSKSRLNVNRSRCMQEIVCGCAPVKDNTRSSRCGFNAMIRLLRSEDNGWYISLRQNNVSLGKVFSIVGSFFGCIENVPFTKRALKTLCGKINKEQSDSDSRKTMDILSEMKANDPTFNYIVQVDEESRIKTLMWVNDQARSMELAIEAELPNTVHRDSEESYQEKRTSLSGVSLRFNLPIERHASKIYTRAMFEQFGEALYKAGAYVVDVVQPMAIYKLTHVDAATRARWSKVEFIVKVNDDKSFFICECGSFEYSGMASVLGQGPIARCEVDNSRDGTQIANCEEHVYIEEGTGDFDPLVAGVCCAEELVLDDGDNASGVGAVDDKADEDDAHNRPTKRAKL